MISYFFYKYCKNVFDSLLTLVFRFYILKTLTNCAAVAQSVEQGTENPCVGSSILPGGKEGLFKEN